MPYPIACPTRNDPKRSILAEFQDELVGVWVNQNFPGSDKGGSKHPLSYNIMPLPETSPAAPNGYILKNFRYTEKIRFNDCKDKTTIAVGAGAPNRGGLISQDVMALFYEQQVKFAEGPLGPKYQHGPQVVHVENGTWLSLPIYVQQAGPFPPSMPPPHSVDEALQQPSDITIAKQINVPHGNSVLALGRYDTLAERDGEGKCHMRSKIPGSPVIPDADSPYPRPANPVKPPANLKTDLNAYEIYKTQKISMADYQNPDPHLTMCPNAPLQEAVAIIKPDHYIHWRVTTLPLPSGCGHVTNIPFERRRAKVTAYYADYWMLFKGRGKEEKKYLAYTQTMLMDMVVEGKGKKEETYSFPHITCNTLTYAGLYDPCDDCKKEEEKH